MTTNLTNFLQIYTETIKDMQSLFIELYEQEFFSITDIQEKINFYYEIPSDLLVDYDDMIGLEAHIEQDGEVFVLSLGNYLFEKYQQRNYTVDVSSMLESFSETLEDITDGEPLDSIRLYSRIQKQRIDVYITEDVIMQWLNLIFQNRVGSITLDW